jgi:hypothetical protein
MRPKVKNIHIEGAAKFLGCSEDLDIVPVISDYDVKVVVEKEVINNTLQFKCYIDKVSLFGVFWVEDEKDLELELYDKGFTYVQPKVKKWFKQFDVLIECKVPVTFQTNETFDFQSIGLIVHLDSKEVEVYL